MTSEIGEKILSFITAQGGFSKAEAGIVKVYDREKTIYDVIRFRNSLGLDIAMEALREYLKGRGRDIPQLLEYPKLLRMEGSIRGYL